MAMAVVLATVLLFVIHISLVCSRLRTPPGLGRYVINWDGGMKACEGADNSIFDMEKLVVEKKSKTIIALVGDVGLTKTSTDKIKFVLTIMRNINGNYEFMMTAKEENLCNHLSEQNKPWSPFVKEMGITGCPIPKKVYTFKESQLDTAGFPMTPAQAGNYRAKIEMFDHGGRTVCMLADVVVEQL